MMFMFRGIHKAWLLRHINKFEKLRRIQPRFIACLFCFLVLLFVYIKFKIPKHPKHPNLLDVFVMSDPRNDTVPPGACSLTDIGTYM